jgi:S1-C subfamily serine protease
MRICRGIRRRAIARKKRGRNGRERFARHAKRPGAWSSTRGMAALLATTALLMGGGYYAISNDWVPGGEPRRVFRKVSPSIVLIRQEGGHGSGIVLTAEGMILTNRHVIDGGGDLSVTATVFEKGRRTERTFKDVKVVGLHPRYDAALVRVNAPGTRFVPASLEHSSYGVETGEMCYVIGNPGSNMETEVFRNSITVGIVSAASHRRSELDYIQTNAAVNGGNSGGALCDSSGRVIGVITYKPWGTEGIGLAIPCSELRWREFYSPVKVKYVQRSQR